MFIAINVDKAFEEIARVVLSKTNEEDLKYICFSLCHKMFFVSHNFDQNMKHSYDTVDLGAGDGKKGDCPC